MMRQSGLAAVSRAFKGWSRALFLMFSAVLVMATLGASGCTTEPAPYDPGTGNNGGTGNNTGGSANNSPCPGTQALCGTTCIDTNRDALNCSGCGIQCTVGGECFGGNCQCQAGLTQCGGSCVSTMSDGLNCGACGNACPGGMVCSLGVCSATCAGGLTQCGASCVDPTTDVVNCGSCGTTCAVGTACVAGACACPSGQFNCSGACVDPLSNAAHCGACGNVCTGGRTCFAGMCQCPAGMTCNDGTGGAGGTGGTGGTGGGAGTGGVAGSGGGTGDVDGGYIESGDWHGYAWTATSKNDQGVANATISPANFEAVTDFPLCAQGTLQASNSAVAMVGWNIAQEKGDNPPTAAISPTLDGIKVEISNPTGGELRLQIQGPNGANSETDRWCAVIPGTGGFIPFGAFNTQCWAGGKGTVYDKSKPIVAVIVLVPGSEAQAKSFDFCVNNIEESVNDTPPPGTGCSLSESGPGTGGDSDLTNDETALVTRASRNYVVQNNVWNGSTSNQSLNASGVSFTVTKQNNTQPTTGAPASYPSVFIGNNFGHSSGQSPKQVSSLTDVPTGWKWTAGQAGEWNASYDVWFSTTSGGDGGTPSGGYLMVWYHKPANAQPLGKPMGSEFLANRSWQVWVCNTSTGCNQGGKPVISYVPADGATINQMEFDLNDFIQNAVTDYPGTVQSGWWLSNVFAGFEIWSGGLNLKTDNFCAAF